MSGKGKGKGQSASSARAAAYLSTFGGAAGATVPGFGFAAPVQHVGQPEAWAVDIDPVVAQALRGLSKRDPTTKLKALQSLEELVAAQSDEAVAALLPAWIHNYKRLCLDNNRTVRARSSRVFHQVVAKSGRKLAPQLKAVIGVWWMAMSDPYQEASHAALSAFQTAFSTAVKRDTSVLFGRQAIVDFLREKLLSSEAELGDPTKESAEDLGERHTRVLAQCLDALLRLVPLLAAPEGAAQGAAPPEHRAELRLLLEGLLDSPPFLRCTLQAKAPAVSAAAYALVAGLLQQQPELVSQRTEALAPLVFGALSNPAPECHVQLWNMVLLEAAQCPAALRHPKVATLLPQRLHELLRKSCYGGVETAAGAVLPLVAQMRRHGPPAWRETQFELHTLRSLLEGASAASLTPAQSLLLCTTYAEVFTFFLRGAATGECAAALLTAFLAGPVVPAALGLHPSDGALRAAAANHVVGRVCADVVYKPGARDVARRLLCELAAAVAARVAALPADGSQGWSSIAAFMRAVACAAPPSDAPAKPDAAELVQREFVQPVLRALSGKAVLGALSDEFSQLVSSVVTEHGAARRVDGEGGGGGAAAAVLTAEGVAAEVMADIAAGADAARNRAAVLASLLRAEPAPQDALAAILLRGVAPPGRPAPSAAELNEALAAVLPSTMDACDAPIARTDVDAVVDWARVDDTSRLLLLLLDTRQLPTLRASPDGSQMRPFWSLCVLAAWSRGSEHAAALLTRLLSSSSRDECALSLREQLPAYLPLCCVQAARSARAASDAVGRACSDLPPDQLLQLQATLRSAAALMGPLGLLCESLRGALAPAVQAQCISALFALALPALLRAASPHAAAADDEARSSVQLAFAGLEASASEAWRALRAARDRAGPIDSDCLAALAEQLPQIVRGHLVALSSRDGRSVPEADEAQQTADGVLIAAESVAAAVHAAGDMLDVLCIAPTPSSEQDVNDVAPTVWANLLAPHGALSWPAYTSFAAAEDAALQSDDASPAAQLRVVSPVGAASGVVLHVFAALLLLHCDDAVLPRCPPGLQAQVVVELALLGSRSAAALVLMLLRRVAATEGGAATTHASLRALWLSAINEGRHENSAAAAKDSRPALLRVLEHLAAVPAAAATAAVAAFLDDALHATTPASLGASVNAASESLVSTLAFVRRALSQCMAALHAGDGAGAVQRSTPRLESWAAAWLELLSAAPPVLSVPAGPGAERTALVIAHSMELAVCCHCLDPAAGLAAHAELLDSLQAIKVVQLEHGLLDIDSSDDDERDDEDAQRAGRVHEPPDGASTSDAAPAAAASPPGGGKMTAATADALLRVVRRQLHRIHSERVASAAQVYVPDGERRVQITAAIAALCVCAVAEAREQLTRTDLERMAHLLARHLGDVAGQLEAAVEGVADAVVELAQAVPGAPASMSPAFAFTFLGRLTVKAVLDGAALSKLCAALGDSCVWDVLLPSVSVLRLAAAADGWVDGDAPSTIADKVGEARSSVLRLLLCLGCVLHAGELGDGAARAAAARHMRDALPFWRAAAEHAAFRASDAAVDAAVREFDLWTEDVGVAAFDACVALLACGAQSAAVQLAGARLSLTPCLLQRASTAAAVDAADVAIDELEEQASGSAARFLTLVGVQPSLVDAIARASGRSAAASGELALLGWFVLLAHLGDLPAGSPGRQRLALALGSCHALLEELLNAVCASLPLPEAPARGGREAPHPAATPADSGWSLRSHLRRILARVGAGASLGAGLPAELVVELAVGAFRAMLQLLPASVRTWFTALKDRRAQAGVELYATTMESPLVLQHELQGAAAMQAERRAESMVITTSRAAREVIAAIEVDEGAVLELSMKMPACFPLKPVEVGLRHEMGVPKAKLRKWLISISSFLRNQNCSMADAIVMWKANVDQEFAGVEPCLICYSVINSSNRSLPKMKCKTCNQAFHSACLYKWFKSSSKNTCPHCQALW